MLQSVESQKVRHDLGTEQQQQGSICLVCASLSLPLKFRRWGFVALFLFSIDTPPPTPSTPFASSTDPEISLITYLIACMIFLLKKKTHKREKKKVVINVNMKRKWKKSEFCLLGGISCSWGVARENGRVEISGSLLETPAGPQGRRSLMCFIESCFQSKFLIPMF